MTKIQTTAREIQLACSELVLRAAFLADAGAAQALSMLFAEQAVLVRPDGQALQGRAAIAAAYAQRVSDRITRHLVTNTLVEVDSGTSARAVSYVLLWSGSTTDAAGPKGRPARGAPVVGEFDDAFVLEAGAWLFLRREARFVLHGAA